MSINLMPHGNINRANRTNIEKNTILLLPFTTLQLRRIEETRPYIKNSATFPQINSYTTFLATRQDISKKSK